MDARRLPRPRHFSFRSVGWLAVLAMVALSVLGPVAVAAANDAPGSNGTIKIHEEGTPSGAEDNDPTVCSFNVEGFGFDAGQSGYIVFETQGGDEPVGMNAGPFDFGPTNSEGFYATEYFHLDPGHYQAALLGKKDAAGNVSDVMVKSKVFEVECASAPSPTPTPTPGGGEAGAAATSTPTPQGGVSGTTGKPHHTLPATDIAVTTLAAVDRSDGWRMVVMALVALLASGLILTPVRSSIRRR
jgi:hypothetical protein